MSDEHNSVGELLSVLNGRGIYNVDFIDIELSKYGFSYNRATDQLKYGRGSVKLGAASAEEFARDMANDPKGGVLEDGLTRRDRMVDAVHLSRAVFKLMFPGQIVPSDGFYGREKGFKANVAAIRAAEGLTN